MDLESLVSTSSMVSGWPRVRPAVNLPIARHNAGAQKRGGIR